MNPPTASPTVSISQSESIDPLPSIPIEQLILDITDRLVTEFNPENIYLFGSHVWGTPTADSDIDLLVIVSSSDISASKRSPIVVSETFPTR